MGQIEGPGDTPNVRIRTDYLIWAVCALLVLAVLGSVPYRQATGGDWGEVLGLVRGRRAVPAERVAGPGLLQAAAAATTLGSNANNTFSSVAQKAAPAGGAS